MNNNNDNNEKISSNNQTVLSQQPPQQEEIPSGTFQQPTEPEREVNKHHLKSLALLKIGLSEFIFVAILLVLFFAILNYFNILPISKIFPSQLGWLPQKEVPSGTSQQASNVTPPPTILPTPDLTQQARQTLMSFLPTILAPILIPEPSQVTIEKEKNPLGKTFISSWNVKESTVAAILITTDNNNIAQLYLSFERPQDTPPTAELASTITSELFSIKPKGKWGCKPLNNNTMTYCENFWEEEDGTRRGLAVKGLLPPQNTDLAKEQPEVLLVFCEHGKESKIYSWKSCEFEFAQTGVL